MTILNYTPAHAPPLSASPSVHDVTDVAAPAANIHRTSEVATLRRAITEAPAGLSILAVSGPGGVGKSFLVSHVLDELEPETLGYLVLSADAANADTRGDFFGVIEGQLFPRSLTPPADRSKDYFPHLRNLAEEHRQMVEEMLVEVGRRGAPEDVKRTAAALLRAGRILNSSAGKLYKVLLAAGMTDSDVDRTLDDAWDLVRSLKGLKESTMLPGPLRDILGVTRRNRIKRDLFHLTATELRTDLSAALVGWEGKDAAKASL